MRCSICNLEVNADGAKFCPKCGIRLGTGNRDGGFVTYAFIGFGSRIGVTPLENKLELEGYLENADKICRRYGAVTEKRKNHVLIAKFRDSPIGQTSAELASYAALEVQEYYRKKTSVDRSKDIPSVFIGIDGGKTDEPASSIGILGDKHLEGARRLHTKAGPGTILVSHNVADTIGLTLLTTPLGFYRLQMQKKPLRIFELIGVKPSKPFSLETEQEYKIIGRTEEYNRIIRLLDETEKNRTPSLTVIVGEAGWGKTELLCQISEKAAAGDWSVLFAHGDLINHFTPYKIWRDIYNKISSLYGDASIPDKEYVQYVTRGSDNLQISLPKPDELRVRIQNAFLAAVESAVSEGPVLVAIDDVHLIDYASYGLLNVILKQSINGALAIVVTSRTEQDFVRQPELRVNLGKFDEPAAEDIIEYFSETSKLDRATVRNLYSRSSGNPFVLTWLVKLSASEMARTPDTIKYVPLNVSELTDNRIATLDAGNLEMLELLYNAGGSVALKDLVYASGRYLKPDNTRLNERVKWLNDFNLITVYKDTYGEYVGLKGYCRNSFRVRKIEPGFTDLNANIRFLEEIDKKNEVLLGHYYSRYGDTRKAFELLVRASENSLEIGANLDAQSLLSTAIETLESDTSVRAADSLASAYGLRADVFNELGLSDLALKDYETATVLYGKNKTPADLMLKYVRSLAEKKLYDESLKNITTAVKTAHTANEVELESRYTELAGDIYINAGDVPAAKEKYEKAMQLNAGSRAEARLKYKTGFAKTMKCDITSGITDFETSRKAASAVDKAVSELFLAAFLPDRGRLPRATHITDGVIKTLLESTALSSSTDVYTLTALSSLSVSPAFRSYGTNDELLLVASRFNGNIGLALSDYFSIVEAYKTGEPGKPINLPSLGYRGNNRLWNDMLLGAKLLLTAELNLRCYGCATTADAYLNSALQIFSELDFDYYVSDCTLMSAETALQRGDWDTAKQKIERREVEAKKRSSYLYLAEYNRIYGTLLAYEGYIDEGTYYIKSASAIYKDYGLTLKEALSYITLAKIYKSGPAFEYYSKAIWLLENAGAVGWIKKFKGIESRSINVQNTSFY